MLAGAETGSRIDSSDLDGFADLKAFGVERNIDFVPAGQALDSLDALLVVHQPDDQDQALESLLLQAQDLGLPTMLLCEPSSCRSKELQSNLGLEIGETILIDRMPAVGGGARYGVTLVLDRFVSHPMFFSGKPPRSLFTHGVTTLKPISEMGSSSNAFEKWSAVLLASDTAWGETGLSSAGGVDKQVIALDSEDHVGELILAATRLAPAPLFVIGDSTWLTNQFLTRNSNSELLLRAIDWLTGVTEKTQTAPASTSVLAVKDFEYFLLLALLVPEAIFITLLFFMFAKESFD
jgi:hypothetical protein